MTNHRPVWWLDPADITALSIDDQFLLGDDVLVAPVLEEGGVKRNIYFPVGDWRDGNNDDAEVIVGPTWVNDYEAPLLVLPWFVRV